MRSAARIWIRPEGWIHPNPPASTADPNKPPIKAWDEEDGRPMYQVMRFQMTAANKAAGIACTGMAESAGSPSPMVVTTATPKMKGPAKWAAAARARATRGRIAPDEITVAPTLELSRKPL